jgi:DNA polymerase elongation subunit (family B)/predicted RNA-binding Zn-ribbon protein involved in translation (DUF1610 family)
MKILALDIETRPALAYVWKVWDENIGVDQIVDPGGVISFAAKWVGESDDVEFRSDFHTGHKKMVKRLWQLLDETDIVIHFNGRRFDVPHIQREFVEAGLLPPSPFKQIDLFETVKRQFRFISNKLKHVAPQLGLQGKEEHEGFLLWAKCLEGDKEAWARMREYNIRDTVLLEEAYEILRPWIKSHPSIAVEEGMRACPKCGSERLQARGWAFTRQSKFRRYQCQECGSWVRDTHREAGVEVVAISD